MTNENAQKDKLAGFFIAPFGIDGQLAGIDYWDISRLAPQWVAVAKDFISEDGAAFEAAWPGNLSHILTKVTAAAGSALVTFRIETVAVASVLLLSGASRVAESQAIRLFVESLRRIDVVRAVTRSANPFQSIVTIKERPLMVVIPWPDAAISDRDHDLVRELAIHMAGAFFSVDSRS